MTTTSETYEKVRLSIPYEVARAELGTEVILGICHPDPAVLAGFVVDYFAESGVQIDLEDMVRRKEGALRGGAS